MSGEPTAVWEAVRDRISEQIHAYPFHTWIEPLRPAAVESGRLILIAPSDRAVRWVGRRYAHLLAELVRELSPLEGIVIRAEAQS